MSTKKEITFSMLQEAEMELVKIELMFKKMGIRIEFPETTKLINQLKQNKMSRMLEISEIDPKQMETQKESLFANMTYQDLVDSQQSKTARLLIDYNGETKRTRVEEFMDIKMNHKKKCFEVIMWIRTEEDVQGSKKTFVVPFEEAFKNNLINTDAISELLRLE